MRVSLVLAASAAMLLAGPALAQTQSSKSAIRGTGRYGTAGCGLGSLAFGDSTGAVQILAATTNTLFGTQTFGITSGTSNCGPSIFAEGTKHFVEANREALAKDISRGQGESIGTLAAINRCTDSAAVGPALQRRYAAIFPSQDAPDEAVTQAILEALHADARLGCGRG
jgi:hypothetical protein